MRRMIITAVMLALMMLAGVAPACTALTQGWGGHWFSGRNFDWGDGRVFAVFNPAGSKRHALALPDGVEPMHWRSKYSSLSLTMVKNNKPNRAAVIDGLNQAGLSMAVLELDQTQYPDVGAHQAAIGSSQLVQYVLDCFATVSEATAALTKLPVTTSIYDNKAVPLHYVLNDAEGHYAVLEYVQGQLREYSASQSPVKALTNSTYIQSLQAYRHFLKKPVDQRHVQGFSSIPRFLRAAQLLANAPELSDQWSQISWLFNGLSATMQPPWSPWPTQWQVVRDNTAKRYCFRSELNQRIRCFTVKADKNKRKPIRLS